MVHLYIYCFVSGLLAANGVPHFVQGISGNEHMTPFGKPSSALVNVIWGLVNLFVGGILLHLAHPHAHELRAFVMFSLGALVISVILATFWSQHPQYNSPSKIRLKT
ncbi:MAG TPA: hypothetical protein VFN51_02995 [Candidatus Saccharimonadales bacterium]|nr:hypothetical protein [Candidatus Saccharimonadales bacterium]